MVDGPVDQPVGDDQHNVSEITFGNAQTRHAAYRRDNHAFLLRTLTGFLGQAKSLQ